MPSFRGPFSGCGNIRLAMVCGASTRLPRRCAPRNDSSRGAVRIKASSHTLSLRGPLAGRGNLGVRRQLDLFLDQYRQGQVRTTDETIKNLRARISCMKTPSTYMLTNRNGRVIYVGVTSNLLARVWQHREATLGGFASKYRCDLLVWFELHTTMYAAITREKQLKAGSRARKIALIRRMNPRRIDLYDYLNTKRPFPSDIVCA